MCLVLSIVMFFFKQKTAYEMRISDWSSDVCSSDLVGIAGQRLHASEREHEAARTVHPVRADGEHACDIEGADDLARRADPDPIADARTRQHIVEIGRAACRERVCPYV